MKRIVPAFLLAFLTLAVLCTASAAEAPFSDVPADAFYHEAVAWARENGVTNGTSDTTFSPDGICTRAQVVTFLWRAAGLSAPAESANPFSDVRSDSYYGSAVLWAVGQKITNGTSDTTFSPETTCTCGQILTFLWRANGQPEPGEATALTAAWPASYYKDAVTWADRSGLLTGMGTFRPDAPCTRALTVTWLHRAGSGLELKLVSSPSELMAAVGSDRLLLLQPGTYDLTRWAEQAVMAGGTGNSAVKVEEVFDGVEIWIQGVKNLVLCPADASGKVTLTVSPRYADVLTFQNCDDVSLRGMTMGHTPEMGSCAGSVLSLRSCRDVSLSALDLYGCGTYGIEADKVWGMTMEGSVIRDCSEGLMELTSVTDALFTGSVFRDGGPYTALSCYEVQAVFQGCRFPGNTDNENSNLLYCDGRDASVRFISCTFTQDIYRGLFSDPGYGSTIFVTDQTLIP